MDAAFFKARQKELGLTTEDLGRAIGRDRTAISKMYNGGRSLKPDEVRALAETLHLTIDEVLARAGMKAKPIVRSMVEHSLVQSEAAPFDWEGRNSERSTLNAAFNLNRPGVEVWAVQKRSMDLAGYMEGDAIVIDRTRAERPRPGDDILAQVHDFTTGTAQIVFRRYNPPFIYAISTEQANLKPHLVDGEKVLITGIVMCSWRFRRPYEGMRE